jgi:hypothetical protein
MIVCVARVVVGFGGYFLAEHLPILGAIGFVSLVATLVVFALGRDASWSQADDTRRADEHEEHPMPDGPAPPFQS